MKLKEALAERVSSAAPIDVPSNCAPAPTCPDLFYMCPSVPGPSFLPSRLPPAAPPGPAWHTPAEALTSTSDYPSLSIGSSSNAYLPVPSKGPLPALSSLRTPRAPGSAPGSAPGPKLWRSLKEAALLMCCRDAVAMLLSCCCHAAAMLLLCIC